MAVITSVTCCSPAQASDDGGITGTQVPSAVEVSPSSFDLEVGQTRQLEALVLDAHGTEVPNTVVQWSSRQPAVASIDESGLVTGADAGSAVLEARYAALVGQSMAQVERPVNDGGDGSGGGDDGSGGGDGSDGSQELHEPAGFSVRRDEDFEPPGSWGEFNGPEGRRSYGEEDGRGVAIMSYPAGLEDGRGTDWLQVGFDNYGGGAKRVYHRVTLKYSAGFQFHVSDNKIFYFLDTEQGGGGDPGYLSCDGSFQIKKQGVATDPTRGGRNYAPNVGSSNCQDGQWHTIEVLLRDSSSPGLADGGIEVWVDGEKTHDYQNVLWADEGDADFDRVRWDAIWGGHNGSTVQQTQYLYLDSWYTSYEN